MTAGNCYIAVFIWAVLSLYYPQNLEDDASLYAHYNRIPLEPYLLNIGRVRGESKSRVSSECTQ